MLITRGGPVDERKYIRRRGFFLFLPSFSSRNLCAHIQYTILYVILLYIGFRVWGKLNSYTTIITVIMMSFGSYTTAAVYPARIIIYCVLPLQRPRYKSVKKKKKKPSRKPKTAALRRRRRSLREYFFIHINICTHTHICFLPVHKIKKKSAWFFFVPFYTVRQNKSFGSQNIRMLSVVRAHTNKNK